MQRRARDKTPYAPKVERVELSDKHVKARVIVTIVLIVTGALAISLGIWFASRTNKGWKTVDPGSVKGYTESGEIRLNYFFGERKGTSATAEYKTVQMLYSEALNRAYPLFETDVAYTDVNNLRYINRHVNEALTVDETLYRTFELLQKENLRTMYLAPVYEISRNIYASESDGAARALDPARSDTAAARHAAFAAFASDPEKIDLKLLGENRIKLFVSDDYRAFMQSEGVSNYIDLWFISNAAIIDCCADALIGAGYTNGYFESCDGYLRNLDDGGKSRLIEFGQMLADDEAQQPSLTYSRALAACDLHALPKNAPENAARYYVYADKTSVTSYFELSSGKSRAAVRELFAYSYDKSCVEVALRVLPFYIAETPDKDGIEKLADDGIYCIYGDNGAVVRTEKEPTQG